MDSILETLKKIGIARLVVLGVMLIAIFGTGLMMYSKVSTPSMSLIYGGIETQDAAKIVTKLESLGVPFQLKGDGTQIYVPSDQAARIRMLVAEAGLPAGGTPGYEILDKTDSLGATSFLQDINYLRALEGELAKTIKSINGVVAVRVHLVLPKKELFAKTAQEPSASIVLRMATAQRLNIGQVRAIQHLVSSAAPGLHPARISIVDDHGTLLARGSEREVGSMGGGNDEQNQVERRYSKMVEGFLEKSLGSGKVRVEANIEMEHDKVTENSEIFDPNGQVIRSTQNIEEGNNSNEKAADGAVTIQNALPNNQTNAPSADLKTSQSAKRNEETVNYEISKTLRTQIREGGKIKRMSIAVLVDGTYKIEKNEQVYVPRSKAELDQISTLVKSAVGFKSERGDIIEIINMKFAEIPAIEDQSRSDMIMGLEKHQFIRIVEILLIGIISLIALIMVIRPITLKVIDVSKEYLPAPAFVNTNNYMGTPKLAGMPGNENYFQGSSFPNNQYNDSFGNKASSEAAEDPMRDSSPLKDLEKNLEKEQGEDIDEEALMRKIEESVKKADVAHVEELIENYPTEALNVIRAWMNTTE